MTNQKPNLSGCIYFSLFVSFVFAVLSICIFIMILPSLNTKENEIATHENEIQQNSDFSDIFSNNSNEIILKNGECELISGGDVDSYTVNVAKFYACDQLKNTNPTIEKWDETTSSKYPIVPFIGYDSLDRTNGKIYSYDLKNFETKSEMRINSTALSILSTQIVNGRYSIFMVGSPTGNVCQFLVGEPMYPNCQYLEQDLKEVGGWYVLDMQTYQIQRLFGFSM